MGSSQSSEEFDYSKLGTGFINFNLSDEELMLIKSSWDVVKSNPEFGIGIMIRIFKVHASIKHVWIFATKLETEEEMRSDNQLRYHAARLVKTFDKLVSDIDADFSKNKEFLIDLGTKHFHYDVKPEYFKVIFLFVLIIHCFFFQVD